MWWPWWPWGTCGLPMGYIYQHVVVVFMIIDLYSPKDDGRSFRRGLLGNSFLFSITKN